MFTKRVNEKAKSLTKPIITSIPLANNDPVDILQISTSVHSSNLIEFPSDEFARNNIKIVLKKFSDLCNDSVFKGEQIKKSITG